MLLKLPSVACLTTSHFVEVVSNNEFTLYFILSRLFLINNGVISIHNTFREIQEVRPLEIIFFLCEACGDVGRVIYGNKERVFHESKRNLFVF